MRTRLYVIHLKGKNDDWMVEVKLNPDVAEEMKGDGIEVSEVVAKIPKWAVDLGLTKWYAAIYQFLYFFRII